MELLKDDGEKKPELEWIWVGCNLKTGATVAMQVILDHDHLHGLKEIPKFIPYRRMTFVEVNATPQGQVKVGMAKFALQSKPDSVGVFASETICNIGELDGDILRGVREAWGEAVLHMPGTTTTMLPKNLRG
jgi:hypothetical protein